MRFMHLYDFKLWNFSLAQVPTGKRTGSEERHRERGQVSLGNSIFAAHETGAYSYRLIAEHFGLHPVTIGRIVRRKMLQSET